MNINLNEAMAEYAKLPIQPYGAHYKRYCAGHKEPPYQTNLSSFIFALSGEAVIYLNDKSFTFTANRVVHCAPNQHFSAYAKDGEQIELFELAYAGDSVNSEYMHSSYELEIGSNLQLFSTLHSLSALSKKATAKESLTIDATTMLQSKMMTYSIFSELFSSAQLLHQSDYEYVAKDAKHYIEQNYMKSYTLKDFGSRYAMSEKYFAILFKQYTGISPIEYSIRCRLKEAKKLLQTTTYSIQDISYHVGYEDALYFSRHFKSRFGLSPSKWRELVICGKVI